MDETAQHMDMNHKRACLNLEKATQFITQVLQHEVVRNQELCVLIHRLEEREAETGRSLTEQVDSNRQLRLRSDELQKRLEMKDNSLTQANQTVALLRNELRVLRQQLKKHQSKDSRTFQDENEWLEGGESKLKAEVSSDGESPPVLDDQKLLEGPLSGITEKEDTSEHRQSETADHRPEQTISAAADIKTELIEDEYVTEEDEEVESLAEGPQTDKKKLLIAISGLSCQLNQVAADMNEQFTQLRNSSNAVNSRLLSIEDRLAALESKNCAGDTNSKKRRRVQNPKIAETVRRLHNSETNCRRYEPEQGLNSPHNEAVTSYLLGAMSASPDLHDADNDDIVSACKTYYETVRRSFRYNQPEFASQAEAAKSSARSRSRRKRLLEARQSVLAEDEVELWKSATADLMSDEEDGVVGGVSGWIVRPPSFRSQDLSELCATLQSRLEATPKYRATHHRRLQIGPPSDRTPPVTYSPEVANSQFMEL